MGLKPKFDAEKSIEVLLYITKRCPNLYKSLKVLFFADKEHLTRYGRLICGDRYVAMRLGPVPSGTYDLVKFVRGDAPFISMPAAKRAFKIQGNNIIPLRDPDLDLLSDSDVECLDWAITRFGKKSIEQIVRISHRELAYQKASKNEDMSLEVLVKSLPDGNKIWEYLSS